MKTIAFATQKGGSGKSTLCLNCAVVAASDGHQVTIVDTDPQGTLVQWGKLRGDRPPDVRSVPGERLRSTLDELQAAGREYVFIDTHGGDTTRVDPLLAIVDYIVVPTRTSQADVWSVLTTIQALRELGKPFAVALNQTPPVGFRIVETKDATLTVGKAVPSPIVMRTDHQDALARGLGVSEFNPDGKAALELREMWTWLKAEVDGGTHGEVSLTAAE
jgi:chromosome partitioning protein